MDWAYTHGIKSIVTSFIKFRPALLSSFDPKVAVNPTPRSWEDVNRIPTELDAATFYEHAKGAIGEGAATEFAAFIKVAKEMPDPQSVIKDPKKAPVPPSLTCSMRSWVRLKASSTRRQPRTSLLMALACHPNFKPS